MRIRTRTILLITFSLAAIIAFLTLRPDNGAVSSLLPWDDKVNHAMAFSALIFPVALFRPKWLLPALLMIAAYGWLIEIVQPLVGRNRDIMDWMADMTGAILGGTAGLLIGQVTALRSGLSQRKKVAAKT